MQQRGGAYDRVIYIVCCPMLSQSHAEMLRLLHLSALSFVLAARVPHPAAGALTHHRGTPNESRQPIFGGTGPSAHIIGANVKRPQWSRNGNLPYGRNQDEIMRRHVCRSTKVNTAPGRKTNLSQLCLGLSMSPTSTCGRTLVCFPGVYFGGRDTTRQAHVFGLSSG